MPEKNPTMSKKKKKSEKKLNKRLKKLIKELKENKFTINEQVNRAPDNRGWMDI